MGCFLSAITMNTEKTENVTGQINIRKVAINYRKKQTSKLRNPTPPLAQDIADVQICVVWKSILGSTVTCLYHDILFSPHFTELIIDRRQNRPQEDWALLPTQFCH